MKKKVIAVLLNLVLFPMGYYYLKSHRRFVALIPVSIFMYTIVSFVAWALPVHILENFHLAILVFLGLAFPVILVIDTLRQCSVPVPADDGPGWLRALYRRPHSYWIVPLYVVLVVTISWAYEPYERPFYHAYHITGMSMAPALQIGDFIWIDKTTGAKDLQRGDIIAFHPPPDPRLESKVLIHRLVGLPGDQIVVRSHKITINSEPFLYEKNSDPLIKEDFLKTTGRDLLSGEQEFFFFSEQIPESLGGKARPHVILLEEDDIFSSPVENGEWQVPLDSYFVMGDFRTNSDDSRRWGFVKADDIVGRYESTYASFSNFCDSVRVDDASECVPQNPLYLFQWKWNGKRTGVVQP